MLGDTQALDDGGPPTCMAAAAAVRGASHVLEIGRAPSNTSEAAEGPEGPSTPRRAVRLAFFSWGCARSGVSALLLYCAALTLGALLAHGQRHLGLVVLSLLPAVFFMGYTQRLFPQAVLRSEMLLTFLWSMVWMAPLVVLENVAYYLTLTLSTLEDQGDRSHSTQPITWGYRLLAAFVRAYVCAAFFEESAKYLALRRLRRAPHVTDPRALAVYGLCAGAAFGTVEDLFIYAFAYGIDNTLARALLSVPLHSMTGLLMGLSMAHDRFVHPGSMPWYKVLALPVLLHGTFDALNFALEDAQPDVALAGEVLLVLGGLVFARRRLLALLRLHPVEHDLRGLLARVRAGDKAAVAEARVLCEDGQEEEAAAAAAKAKGSLGLGGGSKGGLARTGSGSSSSRGYATDLDWSSSTAASSSVLESGFVDNNDDDVEAAGAEEQAAAAAAAKHEGGASSGVVPPRVGPSPKRVALTGLLACTLTAGMLVFLYMVRL